jgi:predicted MFS family arabinose efflux permease
VRARGKIQYHGSGAVRLLRPDPIISKGASKISVPAALEPVSVHASQASLVARWYVLLMMVAVYTLSIADRYAISTVLEPIRLELHLTDSGIAFLTGTSLALFYVLFGFPLSWLTDRYSRRIILTCSVLAWSAMTICTGLSGS